MRRGREVVAGVIASKRANRHCEERLVRRSSTSEGGKRRSNPAFLWLHGLLRGVCHRARVRATRWLAMTLSGCLKFESVRIYRPHLSSPAKAGDSVFQGAGDGIEKPRRTGYSAGACHWARRRRDPVAQYDRLCLKRRGAPPQFNVRLLSGLSSENVGTSISNRSPLSLTIW